MPPDPGQHPSNRKNLNGPARVVPVRRRAAQHSGSGQGRPALRRRLPPGLPGPPGRPCGLPSRKSTESSGLGHCCLCTALRAAGLGRGPTLHAPRIKRAAARARHRSAAFAAQEGRPPPTPRGREPVRGPPARPEVPRRRQLGGGSGPQLAPNVPRLGPEPSGAVPLQRPTHWQGKQSRRPAAAALLGPAPPPAAWPGTELLHWTVTPPRNHDHVQFSGRLDGQATGRE